MSTYKQNRVYGKGVGVLLVFVSFIILQMAIRKTLGVFEIALEKHFSISAREYGFARSIYNVGYGLMQIPLGILLDKFGPRFIGAGTALVLALAVFLLATAHNWEIACLAQFLIGVGSSGAFISSCKVVKNFFPERLFGLVVSIVMALGLIGLVFGGTISAQLLENPVFMFTFFKEDWQNIIGLYGLIILLLAALIFLFTGNENVVQSDEAWSFRVFKQAIRSKELSLIALASALLVGPLSFTTSYQDAFFVRVYGFDLSKATAISGLVITGFAFGTPLLAMLGTIIGNRIVALLCSVLMSISVILMFYQLLGNNITLLSIAALVIGTTCAYQVLLFNMGAKSVSHAYSMTAISIVQFSNMTVGESAYPLVFGALLDRHASGREGIEGYIASDYQYALWAMVSGCVLAFVFLLFVKENRNKE